MVGLSPPKVIYGLLKALRTTKFDTPRYCWRCQHWKGWYGCWCWWPGYHVWIHFGWNQLARAFDVSTCKQAWESSSLICLTMEPSGGFTLTERLRALSLLTSLLVDLSFPLRFKLILPTHNMPSPPRQSTSLSRRQGQLQYLDWSERDCPFHGWDEHSHPQSRHS